MSVKISLMQLLLLVFSAIWGKTKAQFMHEVSCGQTLSKLKVGIPDIRSTEDFQLEDFSLAARYKTGNGFWILLASSYPRAVTAVCFCLWRGLPEQIKPEADYHCRPATEIQSAVRPKDKYP